MQLGSYSKSCGWSWAPRSFRPTRQGTRKEVRDPSPSGGSFANATRVCMGSPGIPHGIVPRRGGAEQGVPSPTSVRRRLVPMPGPAEVCQLRCSGRGEQSGPAAPPARGKRGVPRALRVHRAGELPQGHCPAQCSQAAPNSILPSGPCYDELVAPLYSYSIGASSRYNIFYSASFARLHSESPRGTGTQAGQGRWAAGVPGQVLPLAGLRGPVRRCGGAEQAAAAQSGAEPLSCSPPQAPAAGPPTPGTSNPGSRST